MARLTSGEGDGERTPAATTAHEDGPNGHDSAGAAVLPRAYGGPGADEDPLVAMSLARRKPSKGQEIGSPIASLDNLAIVLEHDPRWAGRVRLDTFGGRVRLGADPITDDREAELETWCDRVYGLRAGVERVSQAVRMVAARHAFSEPAQRLDALTWDGVERLALLCARYLGADDTALHAVYSRCWAVSAVARVLAPGCKVDTTLILVGPQGAGKSQALRTLALDPHWFRDSAIDVRSKDAYQALAGAWLYEFAELDSLHRSELSAAKAFLSSQIDTYRPAYGRNILVQPRQCVIVGSTNEAAFLWDTTGSRRFWPVTVGAIDLPALAVDVEQLWAEAVALYRRGAQWWLDQDADVERDRVAVDHEVEDPWEAPLLAWATQQLAGFGLQRALEDALGITVAQQTGGVGKRAGAILRRAGWAPVRHHRDRLWLRRA